MLLPRSTTLQNTDSRLGCNTAHSCCWPRVETGFVLVSGGRGARVTLHHPPIPGPPWGREWIYLSCSNQHWERMLASHKRATWKNKRSALRHRALKMEVLFISTSPHVVEKKKKKDKLRNISSIWASRICARFRRTKQGSLGAGKYLPVITNSQSHTQNLKMRVLGGITNARLAC